ncbi:MAG: type I DNA topoisomerase [Coprobacillus sp.]|nr:type I DNA topoisomerase [Coprobacillus sp.]
MKDLVVIESSGKVDKIKSILGPNYDVINTNGHICDLSKSGPGGLGVDKENGYTPSFVSGEKEQKIIAELKKAQKTHGEVILATDDDREGEAIAYHVARTLNLPLEDKNRVVYEAITEEEIHKGMENRRSIDMDLVASQEARRVLDKLIGFGLSGSIKRINKAQSAGRVQSPVLKLICDHDKEISEFVPVIYYVINVSGTIKGVSYALSFDSYKGNKERITDEALANEIISKIGTELPVLDIKTTVSTQKPKVPYETSSLEVDATNKLGWRSSMTKDVMQSLYEKGYVTYIRTDSVRLSDSFVESANNFIINTYGSEYVGTLHTKKKNAHDQDAHEGIRPTNIYTSPDSLEGKVSPREQKLYELIYIHTLQALMKPKTESVRNITLGANDVVFHLEFRKTTFDGASVLDKKEKESASIPEINKGDVMSVTSKEATQKSTEPPKHYTEADIISLMREKGIGRPSTYAPTIQILLTRDYVKRDKLEIISTEKGQQTSNILNKYFPQYVDTEFTRKMEDSLDAIGSKETTYLDVVSEADKELQQALDYAKNNAYKEPDKESSEVCPLCGAKLVYKVNKKNGETFLGCSNFPSCRFVKPVPVSELPTTNHKCPKCGADMVYKKGQYGNYYKCTNPECGYNESIKKKYHKSKKS